MLHPSTALWEPADNPLAASETRTLREGDFSQSLSASGFVPGLVYRDQRPLRFPIDEGNSQCPERGQIDSRNQLDQEGRQELQLPAKQAQQHCSNGNIEDVLGGRLDA
jgi:hypothetical protein